MMNFETAAMNTRFEMDEMIRRANIMGPMGHLSAARPFFAGRRKVTALAAIVEVRRTNHTDSARVARRLLEVAMPTNYMDRKAS